MIAKILMTAAVIGIAYLVIRARYQGAAPQRNGDASPAERAPPLLSPVAIRLAAYAVIGLMLAGSAFYLFQSWEQQQQVLDVSVVNPYNGQVQHYEARRGDIDGRSFRTLDGRLIRIAEMERLILEDRR
jgi:hypothetical protein